MGYLIARTMRAYGMGYRELMALPCRAFWALSGYVERLHADEGRLQVEIAACAQHGQAATELFDRLNQQAPAPVVYTGYARYVAGAERDEAGFAELRAMAR